MASMEGALRMTILYIIASPTWGGGEQYIYNLAQHLQAQHGIKPYFLFPPHSSKEMVERFEQVGECQIFPDASKLWRFIPLAGKKLAQLIDKWQIDIVQINNRMTYFAAAYAKRYAHHSFRLIAVQHLVRKAKKSFFWKWAYRQMDVLICVSKCVRKTYLAPFDGEKVFPDVRVIYNSVPVSQEETVQPKPHTLPTLLFHGRICREKGIEPLFEALAQIADLPFRMIFAGNIGKKDQDLWDRLMAKTPVKDKIEYIGFQSDMHQLLSKCHIGISPSIVREAGSLAVIEHIAYGLAVVTSNNGSQPELIRDGENGLLCPPDNPQALANALRRLLTDRALCRKLGTQAQHDFFAYHTYDRFIEEMFDLYRETIK